MPQQSIQSHLIGILEIPFDASTVLERRIEEPACRGSVHGYRFNGAHACYIGQCVGKEEHQAGEQLYLPEAQPAGKPHEADAEPRQGEHQKQLEGLHGKDAGTAALVGQQEAALGGQGVQLLQPLFPANCARNAANSRTSATMTSATTQ